MDGQLTVEQELYYMRLKASGPSPRMQIARCVRITGPIDIEQFRKSATALSLRHPILCSRLYLNGDEIRQRQDGGMPSFEVIEAGSDEQQADVLLSARADEPLDLFEESPFKFFLALEGAGAVYFMVIGHHMFCDGPSLEQLLVEYLDLALNPADKEAPAPGASASNYLAWSERQMQMANDGTLERKKRYWVNHLAGSDPLIHFPGRADDPAVQELGWITFKLDAEETAAFHNRARRLRVTRFALAASAVFRALYETTGQGDTVLSIVVNTRRPPFGRAIGPFASAYPFRHEVRGGVPDDRDVRLLFAETVKAANNYVSPPLLEDEVGWLGERRAKAFYMTDASLSFLPARTALEGASIPAGYAVSSIRLGARAQPVRPPYCGLVMDFYVVPRPDGVSGYVGYETGIVGEQAAEEITAVLRGALGQE